MSTNLLLVLSCPLYFPFLVSYVCLRLFFWFSQGSPVDLLPSSSIFFNRVFYYRRADSCLTASGNGRTGMDHLSDETDERTMETKNVQGKETACHEFWDAKVVWYGRKEKKIIGALFMLCYSEERARLMSYGIFFSFSFTITITIYNSPLETRQDQTRPAWILDIPVDRSKIDITRVSPMAWIQFDIHLVLILQCRPNHDVTSQGTYLT